MARNYGLPQIRDKCIPAQRYPLNEIIGHILSAQRTKVLLIVNRSDTEKYCNGKERYFLNYRVIKLTKVVAARQLIDKSNVTKLAAVEVVDQQ